MPSSRGRQNEPARRVVRSLTRSARSKASGVTRAGKPGLLNLPARIGNRASTRSDDEYRIAGIERGHGGISEPMSCDDLNRVTTRYNLIGLECLAVSIDAIVATIRS